MDCGTVESCDFKKRLEFNLHDVIKTKQQTAVGSIKEAFEGENMQNEHYVSRYRIGLYLHDYRLAVEVGEFGHCDKNSNYEKNREKRLKEKLNCVFIRINHDFKILIFLVP